MDEDEVKIEPEVGAEGEDSELGSERAEDKIAKMREELSACRKEKQEYMDGWQRSKADYVNLLKRIEGDIKAAELRGRMSATLALLPAVDALERSREHGDIPEGFQAIAKQLESAFASLGLEAIGTVGEKFNPALHETFGQDATASVEADDTITSVLEKGWRIGENVIRPAKVRVAHYSTGA